MAEKLDFIGPGSIPQWKRAAEQLSQKYYDDALDEAAGNEKDYLPNYWEGPEDVSRALAETPRDSDTNIFTPDLTLAHLGPIELPVVRMHILAYYVTEAVEKNTGWNLNINKEFVRLGGLRGSAVPSRSKRGITSILMKSTQNVKVNQIHDAVSARDAGFDGPEKVGMFTKIKEALGMHGDDQGAQP